MVNAKSAYPAYSGWQAYIVEGTVSGGKLTSAVVGLIAGVPREVWLVVSVVTAAFLLLYLYRQITLGKIRETKP